MFKNAFANLQKVGKALMLPVSVLPVSRYFARRGCR